MASVRDYAESFWSAALTRYARAAQRAQGAKPLDPPEVADA